MSHEFIYGTNTTRTVICKALNTPITAQNNPEKYLDILNI